MTTPMDRKALELLVIASGVATDASNITDAQFEAYDRFARMVSSGTMAWAEQKYGGEHREGTAVIDTKNEPDIEMMKDQVQLANTFLMVLAHRAGGVLNVTDDEVDEALNAYDGISLGKDKDGMSVNAHTDTRAVAAAAAEAASQTAH